jgi:hypothetical protein
MECICEECVLEDTRTAVECSFSISPSQSHVSATSRDMHYADRVAWQFALSRNNAAFGPPTRPWRASQRAALLMLEIKNVFVGDSFSCHGHWTLQGDRAKAGA